MNQKEQVEFVLDSLIAMKSIETSKKDHYKT